MVGYAAPNTAPSNTFNSNLLKILQTGAYNEPQQLPDPPKPKSFDIALGLPGAREVNVGGFAGGGSLDNIPGDIGKLMRAIRGQESGGRYTATNPSGASGAYQILRSNFEKRGSGWDMEALGRDVSYQQFMSSPAIQDAIAKYKLGQYLKKWGMAGAAATWYGGEWGRKNMYSKVPQNGYPSMYDYVMAILRRAG